MQKLFKSSPFILSVIVGFILLIPFVALELINRWKFNEGFPFSVFTFTWVLQIIFIRIILGIIRDKQAGKSLTKNSTRLCLQIFGLLFIAYVWGGWIIDQWSCLMGVPNCD